MGLETVPVGSWWEQKQADVWGTGTLALTVDHAMAVSVSHLEWRPAGDAWADEVENGHKCACTPARAPFLDVHKTIFWNKNHIIISAF